MKPTHCLVAVMVIATPVQNAQVDCADWGTLAFFKAAEVSDVTRCLQAGATPNVLPLAALRGNAGAVKVLLEAGANLEARTEDGTTSLHNATILGHSEAVTVLARAGANLEARNEGGNTPLHMAALGETAGAVTVLTRAGADLEARAEGGNTPLHMAALGGNAKTVTALLEAGADPKARDNSDELPFDYARDNEKLQGTDAYWKLNEARFP